MTRDSGEHTLDVGLLDDNGQVGDIVHATVIEPGVDTGQYRTLRVVLDLTAARTDNGSRAIRVLNMPADGRITAAEAHFLAVDVSVAADQLKAIRTQLGYDT
jgi:hypothetical protein